MSSEVKKAANRENSRKSTGPKSARGKAKSGLNALKHGLYATTPLVPGENEDAYRELAKLNQEYFAPVGPVENMLVHQINVEQWKLRRIEQAEIVYLEQVRANEFEEFLFELDDGEFRYIRSLLTRECPEKIIQLYESKARSIAAAVVKEDENTAEGAKLHTQVERHIADKLKPFLTTNDTMYGALIESSNLSPHANLDQMRRQTARVYLAYVDKLSKLQESRLTVNFAVHPVAPVTVTKFRTVRLENTSGHRGSANQDHQKPGSGSQNDAGPLPIPKSS